VNPDNGFGAVVRIVVSASLFWVTAGVISGWVAVRVPLYMLSRDTWLTKIRRFERAGRWYEQTWSIRRWKDRLPEGGAWFAGGRSRRTVIGGRRQGLDRFAAETRRAEWVHWIQIALAPSFGWLVSAELGVIMTGVMALAHLPFIAVQRYNRARVLRILARRKDPGSPLVFLHGV